MTIDDVRALVAEELAEARSDRSNFACPSTCGHIGCAEALAACDGRIDALKRIQEALPPTECRECGAPLADFQVERGDEDCSMCQGPPWDTIAERDGLR